MQDDRGDQEHHGGDDKGDLTKPLTPDCARILAPAAVLVSDLLPVSHQAGDSRRRLTQLASLDQLLGSRLQKTAVGQPVDIATVQLINPAWRCSSAARFHSRSEAVSQFEI